MFQIYKKVVRPNIRSYYHIFSHFLYICKYNLDHLL
uniref:Uncharacterized protein n=1 Tax=Myoviridae sp. ctcyQ27 TaxID=2825139 RepID=A0A8S5UF59_9CAUD|nr:MAG TPA: hypothetical protein [Myoviridae sp. ctcyQ27]